MNLPEAGLAVSFLGRPALSFFLGLPTDLDEAPLSDAVEVGGSPLLAISGRTACWRDLPLLHGC
jgi:hypothetical protein